MPFSAHAIDMLFFPSVNGRVEGNEIQRSPTIRIPPIGQDTIDILLPICQVGIDTLISGEINLPLTSRPEMT